jgi:hypothetical protein
MRGINIGLPLRDVRRVLAAQSSMIGKRLRQRFRSVLALMTVQRQMDEDSAPCPKRTLRTG